MDSLGMEALPSSCPRGGHRWRRAGGSSSYCLPRPACSLEAQHASGEGGGREQDLRRGSKQQGGEQRWGVFLQHQLKAASSIVQDGFNLRAAQDGDSKGKQLAR
ncbi:hypothetical protein PVAP13_9KG219185 [Panicum virgatum]|uniref:Uncharacterized protein n=1 Tax=Panicum virgatum TaxID=38727 RepID=A0A8T0NIK9_PANVG|nr:hypothetical protein PVAP13_9KG219185 [Panicum virgatum]